MSKRQIEISKANLFEIDPSKKYILVLPREELTQEDATNLNKRLTEWGVADAVSVLVRDPSAIKVVEL